MPISFEPELLYLIAVFLLFIGQYGKAWFKLIVRIGIFSFWRMWMNIKQTKA